MSDSVRQALAARVHEHRTRLGLTTYELADAASASGLRWERRTVGGIERCTRELSAEELIALPAIFRAAAARTERPDPGLSLADFVPKTFAVELHATAHTRASLEVEPPEALRKIAGRLGMDAEELDRAAQSRWGCSFLQERDRRALSMTMAGKAQQPARRLATMILTEELRKA